MNLTKEQQTTWIARITHTIKTHRPADVSANCKACGTEITDPNVRKFLWGYCSIPCVPREKLSAAEIHRRNSLKGNGINVDPYEP